MVNLPSAAAPGLGKWTCLRTECGCPGLYSSPPSRTPQQAVNGDGAKCYSSNRHTEKNLLRIIVTGLYETATDVLKRLEQFIYDCTLKRIYFVVDNIISQISIFKMLELF